MINLHAFAPVALALGLLAHAAPAAAAAPADPCALLFVPPGYQLSCTEHQAAGDDWRLVVRPENSPFGELSELSLEPVEEPVEDPRAWLRDQLSLDLTGLEDAVRALAENDDSPLADARITASLEAWLGMMSSFAEWPLESCVEPSSMSGGAGLACDWTLGPFHQHLVTRLVERGGQRYMVRIRAMNERRLRHLVAIANSL
jgi:hypothetical protein